MEKFTGDPRCQKVRGAAQKLAIVRTCPPPRNIHSRLEECLLKGGGHLEDIMFRK